MRISKTTSRAAPKTTRKPTRSSAPAKSKPKSRPTVAARPLAQSSQPSQLSGLKLAMQRLADGVSKVDAQPLSAQTAQGALAALRGD